MAFTIYKGVDVNKMPTRLRYNGCNVIANRPTYYDARYSQGVYLPNKREVAVTGQAGIYGAINISNDLGANAWTHIDYSYGKYNNRYQYGATGIVPTGIDGKYVISVMTNSGTLTALNVTTDEFDTIDTTELHKTGTEQGGLFYIPENDEIIFIQSFPNSALSYCRVIDPTDMSIKNTVTISQGIPSAGTGSYANGNKVIMCTMSASGYRGKMFLSTDAGRTFNQLGTALPTGPNSTYIDDDVILVNCFYGTSDHRWWRSTDNGATFTIIPGTYSYGTKKINGVLWTIVEGKYLAYSEDLGLTWTRDPFMVEDAPYQLTNIIELPNSGMMLTGYYNYMLRYPYGT